MIFSERSSSDGQRAKPTFSSALLGLEVGGSNPPSVPKSNFYYMENKEVKVATLGMAEEFRNMSVGEVVEFPLARYNYNSVRSTPATALINEQIEEGKRWKTKLDKERRSVIVTRTA